MVCKAENGKIAWFIVKVKFSVKQKQFCIEKNFRQEWQNKMKKRFQEKSQLFTQWDQHFVYIFVK